MVIMITVKDLEILNAKSFSLILLENTSAHATNGGCDWHYTQWVLGFGLFFFLGSQPINETLKTPSKKRTFIFKTTRRGPVYFPQNDAFPWATI